MRKILTLVFLASALSLFAQFPPIDLEWSAIRPDLPLYGPSVHIARDPVYGEYVWASMVLGIEMSPEANLFLPDGTDVTPLFPTQFGMFDGMIDFAVRDSMMFDLMRVSFSSGYTSYWDLGKTGVSPWTDSWALVVQNDSTYSVCSSCPSYPMDELPRDLLLTEDALYVCGTSYTEYAPNTSVARLVKVDLQGNILWNVTWDASATSPTADFSSVAIIGDSVFCAAFPNLVIFDRVTGALIDAYDFTNQTPALIGDAELLAKGSRLYWSMSSGDDLHFGQFDFAINQGQVASVVVAGQIGNCNIAVDDQDRLWLTSNSDGQGRWFRWDADLEPDGTGTLYESIDDVCFVNGKISFTGVLDSSTPTVYVITGTPQP